MPRRRCKPPLASFVIDAKNLGITLLLFVEFALSFLSIVKKTLIVYSFLCDRKPSVFYLFLL